MKKSICLIVSVLLAILMCFSVSAEGTPTATITEGTPIDLNEKITLTLSLEEVGAVTSATVQVTCTEGISLVSGEFLKASDNAVFTLEDGKGEIAATDINGELFRVVVEGVKASASEAVTIVVKAVNGEESVLSKTVKSTIQVYCEEHTLGKNEKYDKDSHARICSVCNYALESDHVWDNGQKVQEPTCQITGSTTYTCTVCGEKKGETIPTVDHRYTSWQIEVSPTCSKVGVEVSYCAYCFQKTSRDAAKIDHILQSNGRVIKNATCTANGVGHAICSICGETVASAIPAKGHTFIDYTVIQAATCTENGVKESTCKYCNATKQLPTNPIGHSFDAGVVTVEPTTTSTGILVKTCTMCGEQKQERVAQLTQNKEEEENNPVEEEKPAEVDYTLYIIIGASALAFLLVLVVVIIVVAGKKKAKKNKKAESVKTEIVS